VEPTSTPPPTPTSKPVCPATIQSGSKGSLVKTLQQNLNSRGIKDQDGKTLVVDGDFGPKTLYAVKSWQKHAKITVDGIAGPQTWHSLGHCWYLLSAHHILENISHPWIDTLANPFASFSHPDRLANGSLFHKQGDALHVRMSHILFSVNIHFSVLTSVLFKANQSSRQQREFIQTQRRLVGLMTLQR
jgi:hypothetical protein